MNAAERHNQLLLQRVQNPRTHCWKATLWVADHLLVDDVRPVSYFISSPRPDFALPRAHQLWELWEKIGRGIDKETRFPEITGTGFCINVDKGDWKSYWLAAVNYGRKMGRDPFIALDGRHCDVAWTMPGIVFDVDTSDEMPDYGYADLIKAQTQAAKPDEAADLTEGL